MGSEANAFASAPSCTTLNETDGGNPFARHTAVWKLRLTVTRAEIPRRRTLCNRIFASTSGRPNTRSVPAISIPQTKTISPLRSSIRGENSPAASRRTSCIAAEPEHDRVRITVAGNVSTSTRLIPCVTPISRAFVFRAGYRLRRWFSPRTAQARLWALVVAEGGLAPGAHAHTSKRRVRPGFSSVPAQVVRLFQRATVSLCGGLRIDSTFAAGGMKRLRLTSIRDWIPVNTVASSPMSVAGRSLSCTSNAPRTRILRQQQYDGLSSFCRCAVAVPRESSIRDTTSAGKLAMSSTIALNPPDCRIRSVLHRACAMRFHGSDRLVVLRFAMVGVNARGKALLLGLLFVR